MYKTNSNDKNLIKSRILVLDIDFLFMTSVIYP